MKFIPAAPGFAVVFNAGTEEEWSAPLVGWDNDVPGNWDSPQPMIWSVGDQNVAYASDFFGDAEIMETE